METLTTAEESALHAGIKTVGVGKKGSWPLTPALAREILAELRAGKGSPAARGAFFAALFMKGVTPDEMVLDHVFPTPETLRDPLKLAQALCGDAPFFIQDICGRLLSNRSLDQKTAKRLGAFLFSEEPGDGVRGLAASVLRIRYETPEEYSGLLESMQETITPPFRTAVPEGDPVIQIAEPFDGVDQSYLLTPLIAHFLGKSHFRVVHLVGRNSGPKAGINLLDLIRPLGLNCMQSNEDLKEGPQPFGWYLNQPDLSRPLDRWIELRRDIVKRPFLSTLEKFLNPVGGRIIITSAFHPPYAEKMAAIAEQAGFPGSIVVRNGLEGSLAFPLKRTAYVLCSARQNGGHYLRRELPFDPAALLGFEIPLEEKIDPSSLLTGNSRLIEQYAKAGKSGNEVFNYRVQVTCTSLMKAVEWVEGNIRE